MAILNDESGKYADLIVQDASGAPTMPPDFKRIYDGFAERIVWIDEKAAPGSFQMNTAWYSAVPERDPIFEEHVHRDYGELVGFLGSDPDDPHALGGKIEFTIDGEAYLLTKSTIIYLPPGVPHNPMRILEVDRPILHFSVVDNSTYDGDDTYK